MFAYVFGALMYIYFMCGESACEIICIHTETQTYTHNSTHDQEDLSAGERKKLLAIAFLEEKCGGGGSRGARELFNRRTW